MSTPPGQFDAALHAARRATAGQSFPAGALYLVPTPIGNLADVSLRALHVLALADTIACEDTRHSGRLLAAYDLGEKPLLALHEHNERQAASRVLAFLQAGQRVACISDAGTPALSDPGARLVRACQAAGLRVVPLPGASSVTCAISAAGLTGDGNFLFLGFLPSKGAPRRQALAGLAQQAHAVVLLEAPHRMRALGRELATLGARTVTVARELSKQFEQIVTLPCAELPYWLDRAEEHLRGEFTLVLHPTTITPAQGQAEHTLALLLRELPLRSAVALATDLTGRPRNELYKLALRLQEPR